MSSLVTGVPSVNRASRRRRNVHVRLSLEQPSESASTGSTRPRLSSSTSPRESCRSSAWRSASGGPSGSNEGSGWPASHSVTTRSGMCGEAHPESTSPGTIASRIAARRGTERDMGPHSNRCARARRIPRMRASVRRMVTPIESTAPEVLGLGRLHPEQRDAVTHGDGPLLIVAGAGTGKTQVVTHRIAWLISEKKARPEQIVALTFTDKAAAEMESRVDQLVPYGLVGATIATFNAFCDRLVREHAVELGITSRLRVESQAEILVFLRERLFELGLERYLPLGRPDAHLAALAGLFDRARNEDVSPS